MTDATGSVLLISNKADEIALIRDALSRSGLGCEHAVDTEAALGLTLNCTFDAVLLGRDMSPADAVAFLKAIAFQKADALKKADAFPKGSGTQTPVLIMSDPGRGSMPVDTIKYMLAGSLIEVDGLAGKDRGAVETILELASRSHTGRMGARLQEEISKLSYFADNMPECLMLIDRNGTIIYANRALHDKYEYPRGDLTGAHVSRLLGGPGDMEHLKALMSTGKPGGSNVEIATMTRLGQSLLCLAVITPRSSDSGAVFAYLLLLQDITDSRYTETRLQRRLSTLTNPEVGLSPADFCDLILRDPEIQELQDTLATALGVSAVIVAPDGTPLNRGSNFTPICSSLSGEAAGRCRGCLAGLVLRALNTGGVARCTCPCTGLAEAAIPMAIKNVPAAFWIVGQVIHGEPNLLKLAALLEDEGTPSGEIKRMIASLPRVAEYQYSQIIATFSLVSDKVTRQAIQNLQQGKYINERNLALDELQRSEQLLKEMSFRDGLTGMHNRAFFERELDRLGTEGHTVPVSFVAVDVDGLKLINDTLGHAAGDQHIKLTGHLLYSTFSDAGTVCRIGGDEFCILLPGCDGQVAEKLLEQLRSAIRAYNESGTGPHVSMSAGFAVTAGGESMYDAYKRADRMMYENKMKRDDYARSKAIDTILLTLSERDYIDHGHTKMLTTVIDAMAAAVGVGEVAQANLKLLARLHDLGKIGVPDEIVMKPGKLDDREWVIMRSHVEIGANIASRSFHLGPIAPMIRHHHERYDGTGYPTGLRGDQIPIECRIMAIADSYDAMIADRPYRKGLGRDYALGEILKNAGTQFDPELVAVFEELVRSGII